MVFPILKLKNKSLMEFHSVSSWVFLIKYPTIQRCGISKERLSKTGKDKQIWKELQRQLNQKRFKVKKGVLQDATFITSRRSKDGTWVKKNSKSHFGFKLHSKIDIDNGFV